MRRRDRLLAVLAALLLIALFKFGQQLYSYWAYHEERVELVRLEEEIGASGLGVIDTQVRADSIRSAIEKADLHLRTARNALDRFERQVLAGPVTMAVERGYRQELDAYNRLVNERNAMFSEWRDAVDRNHEYVEEYNLLVDSIRKVAAVIGEPFYPIASPAELAARREAGEAGPY
jgi:hypothetical protein